MILALALLALSSPTPATPANASVAGVDVDPALVDEITGLTAELVRAAGDPARPSQRVVDVLAARLEDAGVDVTAAGVSLKAVVHGRDRKAPALLLIGRADVDAADASAWSMPPFEGAIERGRLIGRGVTGPLAMDALDALALVALTRAKAPLARDVIFVVAGGAAGLAGALTAWPELGRAEAALDGSGAFVESGLSPGEDLVEIAAAEKGSLRFRLEARGPAGPASAPPHEAAADRVARAAARWLAAVDARPLRITPPTARRLADIGAAHGGFTALLLSNSALASAFLPDELRPAALFHETCALTSLSAPPTPGSIPAAASASFDCRLLPGTDPHAFRDDVLRAVDDPRVDVVVDGALRATGSDPDSAVVNAVRARMKAEVPGAAVVTTLAADFGGCRPLREAHVPCAGFVPVLVTSSERAAAHGTNESVRTAELEKALSRVVDIVASLAR